MKCLEVATHHWRFLTPLKIIFGETVCFENCQLAKLTRFATRNVVGNLIQPPSQCLRKRILEQSRCQLQQNCSPLLLKRRSVRRCLPRPSQLRHHPQPAKRPPKIYWAGTCSTGFATWKSSSASSSNQSTSPQSFSRATSTLLGTLSSRPFSMISTISFACASVAMEKHSSSWTCSMGFSPTS